MGQRAGGGAVVVVKTLMTTLALMAAVSGCGVMPPVPILTPIEVKVPVATPIYCRIATLDKPALPLAALKTDSSADDSIRAYAATVAILKGAVRQRDLEIAGCAAPIDSANAKPVSEDAK